MKSPFIDEIVDTLFNYYLEHQEGLVKEYEGKYKEFTDKGYEIRSIDMK